MPEVTVSAAAMRIIKLLVGNPPQTVGDLIRATGVTRTAVTEQLNDLVAAGFVQRTTERLPGRGRPRNLYAATDAALVLLFAGNQRLVVPAMWRAIQSLGGKRLVDQVLERVSQELADHYRRQITATDPHERLREFMQLLEGEGVLVEMVEDEGVTLRKRSCPFISMFDRSRFICTVDREMMGAIVGAPVRHVQCRHDGDPCCSFEIATNGRAD